MLILGPANCKGRSGAKVSREAGGPWVTRVSDCKCCLEVIRKLLLSVSFKFILFILFLAVLGLCCCVWAFPSCGERGLLFLAVCGPLTEAASLVAEHGL